MASFIERQSAQFSPYAQQVNVELASQVGMVKQAQYDQGVQKVENYISSLSGLDVIREADQKYLNNKINSLTTDINKIAGSTEWSDRTIQNQVGAMASKIYNDPTIQNAMSGTLQYKKLLSDVGEAKKSGKGYSVQNEWEALSSAQGWLSDPTPGASYSGKSYTPYVDVNDKVLKYFKDKKPNWQVNIDPLAKFNGGDGVVAYAMVEGKKEYIDPVLVKQELSGILQPEDYNQLSINGRYDKRYYNDPSLFLQSLERDKNSTVKAMQAQIDAYSNEKGKNENNPRAIQQLNGYIDQLTKGIETTTRNYESYKTGIMGGNMEGVKSAMYTDNYLNQWASNLGYTKEEISYKESPLFKSIMDQRKAESDHQKNLLDMEKTVAEIAKINAEAEYTRQGKPKPKSDSTVTDEFGNDYIPQPVDNQSAQLLARNFAADTEVMASQLDNEKYKAVYDHLFRVYKGDQEKLSSLFNVNSEGGQITVRPKKGKEDVVSLTFADLQQAWQQDPNAVTPSVRNTLANVNDKQLIVNARRNKFNEVVKDAEKTFNLQDLTTNRPQSINVRFPSGESFSYNPMELVDFNTKLNQVVTYSSTPGTGAQTLSINQEEAQRQFTSPKQQFAYQAYQKYLNGQPLSNTEQVLVDNIVDTNRQVNIPGRAVIAERQNYINSQVGQFTQFERAFTTALPTGKPEDKRNTITTVQRLYNSISEAGGAPVSAKTLGKFTEADNTVYELQHKPSGAIEVKISNPAVSKEAASFVVEPATARSLGFTINDPVRDIRQLMGVNRTPTGGSYTGRNFQEALSLSNPNLQKYSVKYNIVQDSNGGMTVDLYVYDKNASTWVTGNDPIVKPVPSLDAAYQFLNNPALDNAIAQSLKPTAGIK